MHGHAVKLTRLIEDNMIQGEHLRNRCGIVASCLADVTVQWV